MNLLETIIAFLAPHSCLRCGAEGSMLCNICITMLPPAPARCYRCAAQMSAFGVCSGCSVNNPCAGVVAVTPYTGLARQLVRAMKFERAAAAAESMARAMAPVLPCRGTGWLVTHAPTAYARARQRGYDQAELIARHVARRLGVPYSPLLARTSTVRQLGQTRTVRQQQMEAAFRVRSPSLLAGRQIVVIDDVITTGSTLESAARLLVAAGAGRVHVAAFAAA